MGILKVLSIGLAALFCLATATAGQKTYSVTNRILLLTTPGGGEDAPLVTFQSYELQYDLVTIPATGLAGNLTLFNSDGSPKYSLVVLTSGSLQASVNGVWQSLLTAAQWAFLEQYERSYGIRRVTLNDSPVPLDHGTIVANQVVFGASNGQSVTFDGTYAGLAHLKSSASIATTGLYHYPAIAYTPLPATIKSVVPVAYFEPSGTDFPTRTWAGVVVTYADGREVMRWYTSFGFWSPCSLLINHVWLAWGTRGLISGWRRTIFLPQVDDLFLTTEITPTNTAATYNYRSTLADIQGIIAWQKSLNSRLPAGSNLKLEVAFNGNGILERNGPDAAWIDIDTESHVPVEFIKPAGSVGDVRWPKTFSTAWTLANLQASDDIFKYFTTGGIAAGDFTWTSHTFTHENWDNASSSDIDNEIKVNLKMAGTGFLNLPGSPYWSGTSMVTPQISGLHNENALKTLMANGITTIVGDNSRPSITPSNPYDFWVSTVASSNYAGYTVIPRWPCHVYYHCTKPAEIEYVYNIMYNATLGISNWQQILDREGDRVLLLLLGIRHDPTMFHQANLRNADMPGQLGVLQQWIEAVFTKYNNLVDWPVTSLKGDDLAQLYREKTARNTCGVSTSYDLIVSETGQATVSTVRVTSTGSCKVPVTVPGSVVAGADQTVEKIGNDFSTVWISAAGQTKTFSLSPPLTFNVTVLNTTNTTIANATNTTSSSSSASPSSSTTRISTSGSTSTSSPVTTPSSSSSPTAGSSSTLAASSSSSSSRSSSASVTRTSSASPSVTRTTSTTKAGLPKGSLCTSNTQCASGKCNLLLLIGLCA